MKRITMALTLLMLSAHELHAACPFASRVKSAVRRVVGAPARLVQSVSRPSPPLFVPAPAVMPLPMPAPKKASFQFFTSGPSGD